MRLSVVDDNTNNGAMKITVFGINCWSGYQQWRKGPLPGDTFGATLRGKKKQRFVPFLVQPRKSFLLESYY